MSKSNFLKLPNGQFVRPFMICGASSTDTGVTLVDSSNKMLAFIPVDATQYDAEKAKEHIVDLILERCEKKGLAETINWDNVFTTFKL
jgi:hypothetical protein